MVQADDGYVWFGTYHGIARFDGVHFKVFTPENTPEIPHLCVSHAHRDRTGRLWFSTVEGMVSHASGRWTRHGPEDGWTSNSALTFSDGADGVMYVTGHDGKVLRRVGDRFEEVQGVPGRKEGGFGAFDASGRFWLVKETFCGFWDGRAWQRVDVRLEGGFAFQPDQDRSDPYFVSRARDGALWIITERELLKVTVSGVAWRFRLGREIREPWRMLEDSRGDLWVGSIRDGAFHVRLPAQASGVEARPAQVTWIRRAGDRGFQSATSFGEDDEGNVWMGTPNDGVARWRPRLFGVVGEEQGLPEANFRAVATDRSDGLWVASYVGGVYHSVRSSPGEIRFRSLGKLETAEVEALMVDRGGGVWASRLGKGSPVLRLEDGTPRVVHVAGEDKMSHVALHEDFRGALWVGGPGKTWVHRAGKWQTDALTNVTAFAEAKEGGTLWAAKADGVFRRVEDRFVEVRPPGGKPFPRIASLHPSSGGGLWLGLASQGLALLQRDGSVLRLGPEHGLPMSTITLLHVDRTGLLWLGGDKGLACVPELQAIYVATGRSKRLSGRSFGVEDGLPAGCHFLNVRSPGVADAQDGRLWFGTSTALVHVHPDAVRRQAREPRIRPGVLGHTDQQGQTREQPWEFGQHFEFPPGTRSVQFDVALLAYSAPRQVMASIQLLRDGQVLSERVGSERSVKWDALPPGRYSIAVAAARPLERWDPSPGLVHFVIQPKFVQTTAFRLSVGLAALALVAGVGVYRVRNVRLTAQLVLAERDRQSARERAEAAEALRRSEARRLHAEAEAERQRQREAVVRDIHDGIGGLVSNLKTTLGLVLASRDRPSHGRLLHSMNSIVSEALVEVRGLMDAMESRSGDVESLADEFRRYGRVILAPHGIEIVVEVVSEDSAAGIDSPLCLTLFRIFKEALANVVKHSQATRVAVRIASSRVGVRLVIQDNGVGTPSKRPVGRGLGTMQRRAAEAGGVMELDGCSGLRLSFVFQRPAAPAIGSPAPQLVTRPTHEDRAH